LKNRKKAVQKVNKNKGKNHAVLKSKVINKIIEEINGN
jgi:hypothetical protein